MRKLKAILPGEILEKEFLSPLDVSQRRLAQDIGVPHGRINQIVRGLRGITADTALRLAHYFGSSPRFWMNLQTHYDLQVEEDRIGAKVRRLKALKAA